MAKLISRHRSASWQLVLCFLFISKVFCDGNGNEDLSAPVKNVVTGGPATQVFAVPIPADLTGSAKDSFMKSAVASQQASIDAQPVSIPSQPNPNAFIQRPPSDNKSIPEAAAYANLEYCAPTWSVKKGNDLSASNNIKLKDFCLPWGGYCTNNNTDGNATFLVDELINGGLDPGRNCFHQNADKQNTCGNATVVSKFEEWFRSPQCPSSISSRAARLNTKVPDGLEDSTCCGKCSIQGSGAVDLYYWPSPDANTQCLSVVGNTVSPLLQDATTTTRTLAPNWFTTETYWGCTLRTPSSCISIITTSRETVLPGFGGTTMRLPIRSPWNKANCLGVDWDPNAADFYDTDLVTDNSPGGPKTADPPPAEPASKPSEESATKKADHKRDASHSDPKVTPAPSAPGISTTVFQGRTL